MCHLRSIIVSLVRYEKLVKDTALKVWLTPEYHRGKNGPHQDRQTDLLLKRVCQRKFEETHSREEFMEIIGRNYLDD